MRSKYPKIEQIIDSKMLSLYKDITISMSDFTTKIKIENQIKKYKRILRLDIEKEIDILLVNLCKSIEESIYADNFDL